MKDNGHKESNWFNSRTQGAIEREGESFFVTDEEVEQALARLQAMVEGESVPSFWENDSVPRVSGPGPVPVLSEPELVQSFSKRDGVDINHAPNAVRDTGRKSHKNQGRPLRRSVWRKTGWGVAAAVVVVGLLASPLGGKAMAAAMQTLYFHNIVGVGQDDLNQIQNALYQGGNQRIDLKQYGSVQVNGGMTTGPQNMTIDEASQALGFTLKTLPGFNSKTDVVNYTQGGSVTFRMNVSAINSLVAHLGGKTSFPESVNGQPITVQVPPQAYETVNNGQVNMSLSERKMPTVEVPGDVDMNQVRQALIGLPFLPDDIRQSLQTSANWQDTLYVPVGGKTTNLTINGYSAILEQLGNGQERTMLWLEDGVLFQLSGSPSAFPTDASIISMAKELSK